MTAKHEAHAAQRTSVKPLIGLFGKSGGGKTLTALLVARGLVGPSGRVTLIDTESRRGSLFADIVPGGYSVIDLDPPFSPAEYSSAFESAESCSDIVIVDSMTHLWDGEGGVLEMQDAELTRMAGDDYRKRDACKMAAWIRPKMELKRFVQGKLLRSPMPVICCLRGQEKTIMHKDERGKTVITQTDDCMPIFDHRFIFELLVCGEMVCRDGQGGFFKPFKITHPHIKAVLPRADKQMGVEFGAALAKWCRGESVAPMSPEKAAKQRLWTLTADHHGGDSEKLGQWLFENGHLNAGETLGSLSVERVSKIADDIQAAAAEAAKQGDLNLGA